MKFWKQRGKGFLALFLTATLISNMTVMPEVLAEELAVSENYAEINEVEDMAPAVEETSAENEGLEAAKNGEELTEGVEETELSDATDSSEEAETAEETELIIEETETEEETEAFIEETAEESQEMEIAVQSGEAETPYTMKVTFAGQTLLQNSSNDITTEWTGGDSQPLQIVLKKQGNAVIDSAKRYLLCIKVPEVFYFNGLPDVTGITGAEQVAIKKNATPQVYRYNSGDTKVDLPGFSPYSGEIRILLNTSVDTITIPNMSISFNQALAGYVSTGTEDQARKILNFTENPLQINLVAVDDINVGLDAVEYNTDEVLNTVNVDSVQLTRGDLITGGSTNTSGVNMTSLDGFKTSPTQALDQKVTTDGTISYSVGTAGMNAVYCKTLTVVFYQPYVEKDGTKYYLSFDTSDSAFQNKKNNGSVRGYRAEHVTYDETNHQFIYTFEDVYLELYQKLFYTPDFSWPKELESQKDITIDYKILGFHWQVTEQTGYTGDEAGWWAMYPNDGNGTIYTASCGVFSMNQPDIQLVSSANPENIGGIAKRQISPSLIRDNGEDGVGVLGFFDIHNEGAGDSPTMDITFEFNTDTSDAAKYYITKVNLPSQETEITVTYTLVNDENSEVTGTKKYTKVNISSAYVCNVEDLQQASKVDNNYYIKKLTYQATLRHASKYHAETAHAYRNRTMDCGLYYGYLEGAQGTTAHASLTMKAVDGTSGLNKNNAVTLTSTEMSTVGTNLDNYIGYNINSVQIDKQQSASITAGNSVTLSFNSQVSSEEFRFQSTGSVVNGYHVLKDGIIYICLPDGVSIPGTDQIRVYCGNDRKTIQSVSKLEQSSCAVNGRKAYWWAIEVNNINANAYKTSERNSFSVQVELATSIDMAGVTWSFDGCVAVRAKNQGISWSDGGDYTSCRKINTVAELTDGAAEEGLASYLKTVPEDTGSTRLGINIYRMPGKTVNLNIARAEAKLDVETALVVGNQTSNVSQVKVTSADTEIQYQVTVSSEDAGYASDFAYYIPIVSENSGIDASAFVVQNEISMVLQKAVAVTQKAGSGNSPFTVYYTTQTGLTADSVRGDSVSWNMADEDTFDYSKVTAVKIATESDAQVSSGSAFTFAITLKADNSLFEKKAGCVAQWKSFGHYTYNKNGEATTNTYPSAINGVRAGYYNNMTQNATSAELDTSGSSPVSVKTTVPTTFEKAQTVSVKQISVSNGTQLITVSPDSLTGTAANNQFQLTFNIANETSQGTGLVLSSSANAGQWELGANTQETLLTDIAFSKALTETTQERYVDITVGNDDIDIIWRIQLNRKVQPASADKSRIVTGEQYQVPKAETGNCEIGNQSAFTALYVIDNFTPGNYTNQKLTWMKENDSEYTEQAFPKDTSIIMMEISDSDAVTSYWYYKNTGNETSIDLTKFKHMGGSSNYTYVTQGTNQTTLRYLFVVNFKDVSNENVITGDYRLSFGATAISGASNMEAALDLAISSKATYSLTGASESASETPQVTLSYSVNSAQNDSSVEGKTMALVLTPGANSALPEDAVLQVESDALSSVDTYHRNAKGNYIIPIGTIAEGSKKIRLMSEMFPDAAENYSMTAQLYIAKSLAAVSPMNGEMVASASISFSKAVAEKPALRVTGTRIATTSEWSRGQRISVEMKNIANGKLTVTAYSGLTGNQKVTDLLSSVSGIFDISSGTGIYDESKTSTNTLVLNGAAKEGTYRLLFEVKNDGDQTILREVYYIIIQ